MTTFDVDGIFADFYKGMCLKFDKPLRYHDNWYVPWIIEKFHLVANDEEFWENLPILNGPETIPCRIDAYLTALPPEMIRARERWFKKNNYPDVPIVVAQDKLEAARSMNVTLHIDDKPETVTELNAAGIRCLKYVPYYFATSPPTRYDIIDLGDIETTLEKIKREDDKIRNLF